MKNREISLTAALILIGATLGCSFYNPLQSGSNSAPGGNSQTSSSDNKTIAEKSIDATVGEDRIGVPECDELLDSISEQSKSRDDNYVAKATREFFLNRIRESIKKSIEENKDDKEQMAKNCRDYKKQLDKFKNEEDQKKTENK